jgi:hypothetical protein
MYDWFVRISSSLAVIYFISIWPLDSGLEGEYNSPFEGRSIISVGTLNFGSINFISYNNIVLYKYMKKKEAHKKCELF